MNFFSLSLLDDSCIRERARGDGVGTRKVEVLQVQKSVESSWHGGARHFSRASCYLRGYSVSAVT